MYKMSLAAGLLAVCWTVGEVKYVEVRTGVFAKNQPARCIYEVLHFFLILKRKTHLNTTNPILGRFQVV